MLQSKKVSSAKNSSKTAKRNVQKESQTEIKSVIKYHCKQCGAGFAQLNNYFRHLQTHNDNEMYSKNGIKKSASDEQSPT